MASQFWRARQTTAFIERVGIEEAARVPSLLQNLTTLENSIRGGLKALALTPQACADLGLTWARASVLDEHDFDPSRLSEAEARAFRGAERTLRRLLSKARPSDG